MTEVVPHPKFVLTLPQPCSRTSDENEDQSPAVASMHYDLCGEPSSKSTGKHIPQTANLAATSGHASSDERSADISSLDNLRIKSLRPAIIRGRMNDTQVRS